MTTPEENAGTRVSLPLAPAAVRQLRWAYVLGLIDADPREDLDGAAAAVLAVGLEALTPAIENRIASLSIALDTLEAEARIPAAWTSRVRDVLEAGRRRDEEDSRLTGDGTVS